MKIIGSYATEETAERLREQMPNSLFYKDITLNIGFSGFKEVEGSVNLNLACAVKNSIDKKQMFRLFKKNRINSLKFIDLKGIKRLQGLYYLLLNKELVLRDKGRLKVIGRSKVNHLFNKRWDYATIKEHKILEYRAIVFKDKVIRFMLKLNTNGDFRVKQNNSKFIDANIRKLNTRDRRNIIKAVKCLGLDLAGVDVLLNGKYKFKVIETNSGMALGRESIKLLYNEIENFYC